jgi:hypothetical protein
MTGTPADWQKFAAAAQLVRRGCACFRRGARIWGHPCRLLKPSPAPCAYLERSLLPAAPSAVLGDYATCVRRAASDEGAQVIAQWLGRANRSRQARAV